MNAFALDLFAEQRMADRLREAEHERLVRELRNGSPRRPQEPRWSLQALRRLGGAVRTAFSATPPYAAPSAPLPPSRD